MSKLPFKSGALEKIGLGKIGIGGAIGLGVDAYFAAHDYEDARQNGDSRAMAVAKGVGNFALYESIGLGPMMALQILPSLPTAAVEGYEALGKYTRQMNQQGKQVPFVNSNFNDYAQAFTMRQAGMQMAQASKYNLQQTLMGNEAAYLQGR